MKLKISLTLCLLTLAMMTGCSDEDNAVGHDAGLIGIWDLTGNTVDGDPKPVPEWMVAFDADGTGISNREGEEQSLTWSTSGNTLTTVTEEDGATTGVYSIEGNTLDYTFTEDGSTIVLTWTRRT